MGQNQRNISRQPNLKSIKDYTDSKHREVNRLKTQRTCRSEARGGTQTRHTKVIRGERELEEQRKKISGKRSRHDTPNLQ